jgi:hypothetical protein
VFSETWNVDARLWRRRSSCRGHASAVGHPSDGIVATFVRPTVSDRTNAKERTVQPIPVRYTPYVAVPLLLGAIFVFGTGLMLGGVQLLVIGAMNLAVALAFLVQPWFVVHPDRIEVKNLMGMTLKTHAFTKLADIDVQDGKVVSRAGQFKPVGGWLARSSDVAEVEAVTRAVASRNA